MVECIHKKFAFKIKKYKEETDFYTPVDCESNRGEVMGNGEGKENK